MGVELILQGPGPEQLRPALPRGQVTDLSNQVEETEDSLKDSLY